MKKIFIVFALLLTGCADTRSGRYSVFGIDLGSSEPSRTISNEKCEDVVAIRVFQVLDDYVLGTICEYGSYDLLCGGLVVYMKKEKDRVYYDGLKIKPQDNQCFTYVDSYTYTTKQYNKNTKEYEKKTVPVVEFTDAEVPNPEYEKWQREQQEK